ncbi:hypothetical protein D3C73_1485810 [compost metagenome]
MSAGDGDEAFAQFFFHRIERMIADQVKQPVSVLSAWLVRFFGSLGQTAVAGEEMIFAGIVDLQRTPFADPDFLHLVQQMNRKSSQQRPYFFGKQ